MRDSYGSSGKGETPQEAHRMWVMHALRQDVVVLACLPLFFLHTFQSNQQLKGAEGLLHSSVRNDDLMTYWTLTVWENKEFMQKYRNNGNHVKAMKISRNIADELEKINWEVENEQTPNWKELKNDYIRIMEDKFIFFNYNIIIKPLIPLGPRVFVIRSKYIE